MKTLLFLVILFLMPCCINAQTWQWTHPEPNGNATYPNDDDQAHITCTDAQRNVYVLGDYNDTFYLNNIVRTIGQGSYIAKYDSLGNLLWYKLITASPLSEPTNPPINATDMVVNNNGIFLTGTFDAFGVSTLYQIGDYTFGKYPDSSGGTELFFCQMDFSGNVVWNKTSNFPPHKYYIDGYIGSIYSQIHLATDNNDNIFLGGFCNPEKNNSFRIGNAAIPIKPGLGAFELFIAKFNNTGNLIWSQYSVDSSISNMNAGSGWINSMVCDGNGNLFIHATVNNNEKFGSITYKSSDKTNNYGRCLIKIPSSGGWSFVTELCTYSQDYSDLAIPKLLACDNSNNIYSLVNVAFANGVNSTLLRKVINTPYNDNPQPYLVKMDNNGNVLWYKYFAATGVQYQYGGYDDYADGIYYSNNQLYITGSVRFGAYTDYLVFSKLTVPLALSSEAGFLNYYVAKCDTAGNFNWVTNFGAGSNTAGNAVCTDGIGNVYTAGYYRSDVETLGNLNGSFKNPDFYTYNIFFGKLKDQYIHIDSVSSTTLCPGSNIIIPFTSYGLVFTNKNKFTAEISDANGDFTTPTVIGSAKSKGTGSIVATIPSTLPYGNDYRVRIRSSDTLKTGYNYFAYADTDYKITLLCPAPSSGFITMHITGTSATVKWNVVDCAKGYRVQYKIKGTSKWTTITTNTNTDSLKLNGLTANTTYQWRVATKCKSSVIVYSAYSAIKQFTTAASFAISGVNASAISLTNSLQLMVQPNPVTTSAMLVVNGNIKSASITITDLLGKTLWEKDDVNSNHILLPVEKFASGVYIVKLASGDEKSMVKFVKE